MKDKYYTPEISEFHVGFEYEVIPPVGIGVINFNEPNEKSKITWAINFEKFIYGFEPILLEMSIGVLRNAIKEQKIRVKYLDDDDIKSLGWTHDQTTKDGADFYMGKDDYLGDYYALYCHNDCLRFDDDYTKVKIHIMHGEKLFEGVVKNKSELKRLMVQLGISGVE